MDLRTRYRSTGDTPSQAPTLVQEEVGIHVSIAADLDQAAAHAANIMREQYQSWLGRDRHAAWGSYKRNFFTVAVGGGNTVKAQYAALLRHHSTAINWLKHVRFYFLEESTGELGWESSQQGLSLNFIVPLARKLIKGRGLRAVALELKLELPVSEDSIVQQMLSVMVHPIQLAEARQALDGGKRALAMRLARREAERYQRQIQTRLGETMQFHTIISGIGKNGTLGAFAPYTPELQDKEAGTVVLTQQDGALRVALNRGVLTGAERISLIISGNLKLKALGRFEMEEAADFEQTVMETPLRMLRESYEIAEKVYLFADEQALHFDETLFEFRDQGINQQNKAETREGDEQDGIHAILLHGFMGLFSFTSFLVRLPSAWTVSALHRGSYAKTLSDKQIFPYYARVLRKVILQNWHKGRPIPIAGHSIAGVIIDHLLLSITGGVDGPIPSYRELTTENQQLVDALQAGGIVQLATWAPSDGTHTSENIKNLRAHKRVGTALDYSGFQHTYESGKQGELMLADENRVSADDNLAGLGKFLRLRISAPLVNSVNAGIRYLLNNRTVQQRMLNANTPYAMRIVGARLLKTVSFYGLCKEVNAALHDPVEYQRRHLRALEILLAYDIPLLSIVHRDDFLVSANRHQQEHDYLLRRRLEKEGVSREQDLKVPARFLALEREEAELPTDPLNPHLLIMATSNEGTTMARHITAAMTRFVNENVGRAIAKGKVKPLASVRAWQQKNRNARKTKSKRVA